MNTKAPSRDYRKGLLERLAASPEYAAEYLNAALEDAEEPRLFFLALRDVADAYGGIGRLAQVTNLNRESLYKTLSKKGNPQLDTVVKLLKGVGLRVTVTAKVA